MVKKDESSQRHGCSYHMRRYRQPCYVSLVRYLGSPDMHLDGKAIRAFIPTP